RLYRQQSAEKTIRPAQVGSIICVASSFGKPFLSRSDRRAHEVFSLPETTRILRQKVGEIAFDPKQVPVGLVSRRERHESVEAPAEDPFGLVAVPVGGQ